MVLDQGEQIAPVRQSVSRELKVPIGRWKHELELDARKRDLPDHVQVGSRNPDEVKGMYGREGKAETVHQLRPTVPLELVDEVVRNGQDDGPAALHARCRKGGEDSLPIRSVDRRIRLECGYVLASEFCVDLF